MSALGRARELLGVRSKPRVYVPGEAPSLVLRRDGDRWLVAMLHGGREIAAYTPKEARRQANRLLEIAWLASNPGACPPTVLE
jgi:hypothetical protein